MQDERTRPWFNGGDRLIVLILCIAIAAFIGFEIVGRAIEERRELAALEGRQLPTEAVNINTADMWAFVTLPGLGAKKANDIIAYRQEHGPFKSVDDLAKVPRIGKKMVDKLRPFIFVEPGESK